MSAEAPPFKVWTYPIVGFFTILLAFLFYTYSSYGPYARVLKLSNRSLEQALIECSSDTSALSIVIVGSSLTEYALADPRGIADSISQMTNRKAKVLRVALNYMDMNIAKRIDFFDYISKYPPHYLFLENFSFNVDHTDSSVSITPPIDVALLQIRNYVRKALGMGTADNYYTKWYTFDVNPGKDFYGHEFDSITFRSLQRKKCVARNVTKNGVANGAYDALKKRNSKVVFLDMPQSNKLQSNFLDHQSASELKEVLKFYKTQYRIDYWRFPRLLDDSCFTDGIHLNSKGAMQYQKWFVSEFASKK